MSANATRIRRWRARQATGKGILHIEVSLLDLADFLIASGLLSRP